MHWLPEAGESALTPVTSILKTALLSVFCGFAERWRKCYVASKYPRNDATFPSSDGSSHAVATAPIFILSRSIAKRNA